jgi:hypothetical protein
MSFVATLQRKGARKEGTKNSFARKEKNQNQETSGFEILSCSRCVFYILIIVVGATNSTINNIHLW